ncbi:uncharacterized protein HMPREF1541_06223 [Cyphellophora europaea CBS 101466]|uniref:Kinetochore protein mis13 n=1 Tax=Cyphellophora europaea (strain CBS 101466) TaxID=1220924 RepID=W2RNZ1_CYPE1|nr:uncharacterized protein HMPREF1541_06223 [Cyphellophora europaea CBS 101466]ETN38192.1 hypothetical protein HMPREF1541_06223 [Cyphellophora europaea CBS 101466]
MTAIVARAPLQPLPMSSAQRPPRRLSARLQEREPSYSDKHDPAQEQQNPALHGKSNAKKRKTAYEEEDDGFMFSRVKKRKQKDAPKPAPIPEDAPADDAAVQKPSEIRSTPATSTQTVKDDGNHETGKSRHTKKMSFSTPDPSEKQPVRRSKRLSDEPKATSPQHKTRRKDPVARPQAASDVEKPKEHSPLRIAKKRKAANETDGAPASHREEPASDDQHSATKIALPFADTPVIRRNKEMRENKGKKGERRSSMSLRGRRASSLIESGNSNALPHDEVEVADFYKHIESDGLPEPRRMRQLLTWCATRSLDQKPMGASFEESSAIAAARVIQEELLKDLANKSELSDWFSREEVPEAPKALPERPNPKNMQNAEKIAELEQQIQRLRIERDALESLMRPPSAPEMPKMKRLNTSLLDSNEAATYEQLQSTASSSSIASRVESIFSSLEPKVDAFADHVHKIAQYRDAADNVASRALAISAEKLVERERESRRRAQPEDRERSPRRDLGNVLRGLSRADR